MVGEKRRKIGMMVLALACVPCLQAVEVQLPTYVQLATPPVVEVARVQSPEIGQMDRAITVPTYTPIAPNSFVSPLRLQGTQLLHSSAVGSMRMVPMTVSRTAVGTFSSRYAVPRVGWRTSAAATYVSAEEFLQGQTQSSRRDPTTEQDVPNSPQGENATAEEYAVGSEVPLPDGVGVLLLLALVFAVRIWWFGKNSVSLRSER